MTVSVHTNTSAMIALQQLNKTNDQLDQVQSRINTGLKVNGAKDNASVWAVAQGQRADIGALSAVNQQRAGRLGLKRKLFNCADAAFGKDRTLTPGLAAIGGQ